MRRLHPHQRVGAKAEELLEPDRHLGRQPGMIVQQAARRLPRDVQPLGQGGDVQPRRFNNLLPKELRSIRVGCDAAMKLDRHAFN